MEDLIAVILLGLRLLMVLALFAFLGWSFLTLWRDLKHQAENAAKQHVPALQAAFIGANGAGETKDFSSPKVTIGRHPSCEWLLEDETISARHARLTFRREQWWLEDLGSRNGTFLNGEALTAPVVLADQDEVRCGQVSFTIAMNDANSGSEELA